MGRTIYAVIVDCPNEDAQLASDLASMGASALADSSFPREVQLVLIKPSDEAYTLRPRVRLERSPDATTDTR